MKGARLFLLLLWVALCSGEEQAERHTQTWIEKEIKRSAKNLLHIKGESAFELPVDVVVILIGFDGHGAFGYKLDATALEDLLFDVHDVRRPIARETGEPLSTQYDIDYTVLELSDLDDTKAASAHLDEVEAVMREKMTRVERTSLIEGTIYADVGMEEWETYALEARQLEPKLDEIVQQALEKKEQLPGAPHWLQHNVIVVLNPSKRRMRPDGAKTDVYADVETFDLASWDKLEFKVRSVMKEEGSFGYYYTYNGTGQSTTWISHKNYVVVDVSAGPVKFGRETAPSGAVCPHSLPRILDVLYEGTAPLGVHGPRKPPPEFANHIARVRDSMFCGKLASMIVSAVDHLFLNDIWVDRAPDMRNVMVPLIVLRNHAEFNPFGLDQTHSINGSAVKEQIQGLLPGDSVIFTESLHSLHQHKALAVALYKATTARSEVVVVPKSHGGRIHSSLRHYIDSDILIREFSLAADVLSIAWIGKAMQLRHGDRADEEKRREASNEQKTAKISSSLTRTVPVFVLSLKDAPFDLAFENDELVVTNGNIVIVLQTVGTFEDERIELKYARHFVGRDPIIISTLDVERHIVSGLTMALTGLPPPYELYRPAKGDVLQSWMTLSLVAKHAAQRNALLATLEKYLRRIKDYMDQLDRFIAEFATVFPINGSNSQPIVRDTNWIDLLYEQSSAFAEPPLPSDVVHEIMKDLMHLEGVLIDLGHRLYSEQFEKADDILRRLGKSVASFGSRITLALSKARNRLQCCHLEYKATSQQSGWGMIMLTGVVLLLLVIVYVNIPVYDDHLPLLRR